MMEKVTLGQVFLEVLGLAHANIIRLCSVLVLYSFSISSMCY